MPKSHCSCLRTLGFECLNNQLMGHCMRHVTRFKPSMLRPCISLLTSLLFMHNELRTSSLQACKLLAYQVSHSELEAGDGLPSSWTMVRTWAIPGCQWQCSLAIQDTPDNGQASAEALPTITEQECQGWGAMGNGQGRVPPLLPFTALTVALRCAHTIFRHAAWHPWVHTFHSCPQGHRPRATAV